MNDIKLMNKAADNIRILAASMVEKAKSGHPGGAMGGADFVNVLFSEFLVYDPKNPAWEGRDRYFQDPGHMSPMLYSVLALAGKFTIDELKEFRQWGSVTPGHPEVNVMRGIENTSGPLGQGHTYAVGAAIAAKFLKARLGDVMNQTIYTYISDGGIRKRFLRSRTYCRYTGTGQPDYVLRCQQHPAFHNRRRSDDRKRSHEIRSMGLESHHNQRKRCNGNPPGTDRGESRNIPSYPDYR